MANINDCCYNYNSATLLEISTWIFYNSQGNPNYDPLTYYSPSGVIRNSRYHSVCMQRTWDIVERQYEKISYAVICRSHFANKCHGCNPDRSTSKYWLLQKDRIFPLYCNVGYISVTRTRNITSGHNTSSTSHLDTTPAVHHSWTQHQQYITPFRWQCQQVRYSP